jgi:hypothetical protein
MQGTTSEEKETVAVDYQSLPVTTSEVTENCGD